MKNRQIGLLQSVAAAKSGVSVRSGRRIERVREALPPRLSGRGVPAGCDMVKALGAIAGAGARPDRADVVGIPGRYFPW